MRRQLIVMIVTGGDMLAGAGLALGLTRSDWNFAWMFAAGVLISAVFWGVYRTMYN